MTFFTKAKIVFMFYVLSAYFILLKLAHKLHFPTKYFLRFEWPGRWLGNLLYWPYPPLHQRYKRKHQRPRIFKDFYNQKGRKEAAARAARRTDAIEKADRARVIAIVKDSVKKRED